MGRKRADAETPEICEISKVEKGLEYLVQKKYIDSEGYILAHCRCPGCGSLLTRACDPNRPPEGLRDLSGSRCTRCQWVGVADDKLPM